MNRLLTAGCLLTALFCAGCATRNARKHVESVARDWCMTIRASQVIPIYPLTSDLVVGDVFLVRTPIARQAKEYREKGFLSLDDHRHRIRYTDFSNVYFDGFFKNRFGKEPHAFTTFTNSGTILTNDPPVALTAALAPRAAFPTYSFQAKSGFGLSAAFPIEGVPVALSWLGTDQVSGSVSISDARTYGGAEGELFSELEKWAGQPKVQETLAITANSAAPNVTYLRVVTRIYLARAMEVVLFNAKQRGGSMRAGTSPDVPLINPDGSFNAGYSNLITALNMKPGLLSVADAGGTAKFTSASRSSVGMSQKFDELLAVGYIGFDVPIYENGTLGVPVPTFDQLAGGARGWVRPILETRDSMKTLEAIAYADPQRALRLMSNTVSILKAPEFRLISDILSRTDGRQVDRVTIKPLRKRYQRAVIAYIARPNLFRRGNPQRLQQFNNAFDKAFRESPSSL